MTEIKLNETVNSIQNIITKENEELKEKLKATEEELEKAKNEAKEWEDKYTKLVHQNNINESTIRYFDISCGNLIGYFNHVVKGIIVNYTEGSIISNFHLRDFSNDDMETVRLIHKSNQVEQIAEFIKALWTSRNIFVKSLLKRIKKLYNKFVIGGKI